jgi:hypothetical protein
MEQNEAVKMPITLWSTFDDSIIGTPDYKSLFSVYNKCPATLGVPLLF